MLEPYIRPGIDDRPDYDKALSDEDKASVARLAREDRRLPPEASAKQPEAQAARLTVAGGASVAAAGVDTAVPDYASSFLDMRDPMTSADGVKPSRTDVLRLKWAFALAAVLITAPWVMLNLIAIPNHIALMYGLNTEGPLPDGGETVLATPLAMVIALGTALSIVVTPLISTFSDHTRVIIGRRTPWLVAGGVLAALATLILSATDALIGLVAGWLLMQPAYVMLTAPLAAAISERVPDKYRVGVERWHAVGVLIGQAAGGVIGGMSIAFGATDVFLCAAVLFAVSGVIPVLLAVGVLGAAYAFVNFIMRKDTLLNLPLAPMDVLLTQLYGMIMVLNLFGIVVATCMIYNMEFKGSAVKKMYMLPVSVPAMYLCKFLILTVMFLVAIVLQNLALAQIGMTDLPDGAFEMGTLVRFAGYSFLTSMPVLSFMLLISSRFENMWVPLGIGVAGFLSGMALANSGLALLLVHPFVIILKPAVAMSAQPDSTVALVALVETLLFLAVGLWLAKYRRYE